jgi:hypothetical protein
MFDDQGDVVFRRPDVPELRRGPVPCETHAGCPKGHWKDSPELNANENYVLMLYDATKSIGIGALTNAEARDPFLVELFAMLGDIDQKLLAKDRSSELFSLVSMVRGAV